MSGADSSPDVITANALLSFSRSPVRKGQEDQEDQVHEGGCFGT